MKQSNKAISPVISDLLLLVTIIVITSIAWILGMPYIERLTELRNFEESKQVLLLIDNGIREIATDIGSAKEINLNLGEAKRIDVNALSDEIRMEMESFSGFIAEDTRFKENNLFYERNGTRLVIGLDYNGSGIDLNSSVSLSKGLKRLELIDANHSGGRAVINLRVR